MYPIAFTFAGVEVPSYGLFVILAACLGLFWALTATRDRRTLPASTVVELVITSAGVALIGARLPVIVAALGGRVDWTWILREGGSVQLGVGFGILAVLVASRRLGLHGLTTLDALIPALPLALAVGRIGCLLAGCCYGRPTELAWGVVYMEPVAHLRTGVPLGVPMHPTSVYQALWLFVMFVMLARVSLPLAPGVVSGSYLALEGISRMFFDRFRGEPQPLLLGQPVSTLAAATMALVGLSLLLVLLCGRSRRAQHG